MAAFGLAAVAAAAFGIVESRAPQPMVDIRLFRSRVFGGGTAVMMLWAFGIFGIYFFTSIYLQTVLGFSPTKAGLAFVPMAICMAVFASLAPLVAPRLGAHRAVGLGMALMAGGLYLVARLGGGATFGGLMPGFLIFGAGAGLMNVPLTNAVLHSMPTERSGVASAVMNASRELAGLLGITVIGAVLRAQQGAALRHGDPVGQAFLHGYHDGLLLTVALLAAGTLVAWVALRRSGTDHARPDLATVAAELAPEHIPELATIAGRG
jgi:predicted MFS family arabinose efflux permease